MTSLDSLFSGMRSASTGLTSERLRLDVIAENIANARNTRTADGGPYRRKVVHFEPILRQALAGEHAVGVNTTKVEPDMKTPFTEIFEPAHPDANSEGMVAYPNVNAIMEMADMVTAMRAYESNLTVQEMFVKMSERALTLAR